MKRALSPCRRCRALTRDRSGFCEAHRHSGWAEWQQGKTSTQRGYGAPWRRLRIEVMNRDRGLCQTCKRAGRITQATEVDHIIPKHQNGTDSLTNTEAICSACHRAKTSTEGRRA